jgi:hypothetical protein
MCSKRTQSQKDLERADREAERPKQQPWRNTRPRANQERDLRDVERSLERLESLVGR